MEDFERGNNLAYYDTALEGKKKGFLTLLIAWLSNQAYHFIHRQTHSLDKTRILFKNVL